MVVVIDNYDSFTYNIVQAVGALGADVRVYRNDTTTPETIDGECPGISHVIISPGPCTPEEAGISKWVIKYWSGKLPILGVCLGHQAVAEVFGAKVVRAGRIMHGKTSPIHHDGKGVFADLPNPFTATRYHSLIVPEDSLPACLEVSARSDDHSEIMGVRHREMPVEGVQFHPESILTDTGSRLFANFLEF
ncbi:MAG: aminodeoxychorismate/anthranilate synthase component II [Planctomycetes bacterium]|nr:aminodeoxychorismate/anthranilate synthase component II [Planctomycetota bacterium]